VLAPAPRGLPDFVSLEVGARVAGFPDLQARLKLYCSLTGLRRLVLETTTFEWCRGGLLCHLSPLALLTETAAVPWSGFV
jgi:hypothetical protein